MGVGKVAGCAGAENLRSKIDLPGAMFQGKTVLGGGLGHSDLEGWLCGLGGLAQPISQTGTLPSPHPLPLAGWPRALKGQLMSRGPSPSPSVSPLPHLPRGPPQLTLAGPVHTPPHRPGSYRVCLSLVLFRKQYNKMSVFFWLLIF